MVVWAPCVIVSGAPGVKRWPLSCEPEVTDFPGVQPDTSELPNSMTCMSPPLWESPPRPPTRLKSSERRPLRHAGRAPALPEHSRPPLWASSSLSGLAVLLSVIRPLSGPWPGPLSAARRTVSYGLQKRPVPCIRAFDARRVLGGREGDSLSVSTGVVRPVGTEPAADTAFQTKAPGLATVPYSGSSFGVQKCPEGCRCPSPH